MKRIHLKAGRHQGQQWDGFLLPRELSGTWWDIIARRTSYGIVSAYTCIVLHTDFANKARRGIWMRYTTIALQWPRHALQWRALYAKRSSHESRHRCVGPSGGSGALAARRSFRWLGTTSEQLFLALFPCWLGGVYIVPSYTQWSAPIWTFTGEIWSGDSPFTGRFSDCITPHDFQCQWHPCLPPRPPSQLSLHHPLEPPRP